MSPDSRSDRDVLYRIFEFAPDAILLVDGSGRIIKANAQVERMFGYTRDELLGTTVEVLIPRRFSKRHIGFRSHYVNAPRTRPMGAGVELFGRRKDGSELPVDIMLSPIETQNGSVVLGVVRDATERKAIEQETQRARETSVKELHHRVKNNLQVISSLLHLQSTYTADRKVHDILKESQTRVRSIALVHEKLYRAAGMSAIRFAEYIHDLADDVFRAYAVDARRVLLESELAEVEIGIDTAIPSGLIVNELVSNALKHAFPDERRGKVRIELTCDQDRTLMLTVKDNGIGLPRSVNWRASRSLGLQLVTDLARQLDAQLEVDGTNGTTVQLRFREVHYKDRS